jgi:formate dehydrogenase (coenzyme F420) alpha subunit
MRGTTLVADGVVRTICRMCDTRCGIRVHIQDHRMVDITPDEENPVNSGRMCPRAMAALDIFYHAERIRTPLKRQPDGRFVPIGYARAIAEIVERLQQLTARHGARSVGVWKGEAVGFWQQEEYARRFAHAFGTPNYFSNDAVCFNGRFLGNYLVTGFWNATPDFTRADLILLFGTNPPVCHPPFMSEFADAKSGGAALVVVDPRLNPIACYADIYAQPSPGTDGALAWGLIHYLISTGNFDREFVERYCLGFEKIRTYAQRFTPAYVEARTGVYADVVGHIGALIAKHRPRISLYVGTGLEHHDNGVNNIRALVTLACLVGAVDTPSGLFWPEPMDRNHLTLYDELPLDDQEPIGADRFPVPYQIRKECHTMTAMDRMLGQGPYPLRGLIVTGANPAVTNPNTAKVERALASLDLLVVNDLFQTPTTRLAHYVLPAATFLERSELHINTKYQRAYLSAQVARIPGIPSEYMLWYDLAKGLGFQQRYFPWPDETEVNRYILAPSTITLEQLEAHPEGITYKPIRFRKYLLQPFPTPSGKIELASAYLKGLGFPEIPEYHAPYHQRVHSPDYPLLLTTGARKTLFYHGRHQNILSYRKIHPKAEVEIHPLDADALGIVQGQPVRIVSQVGSVVIDAKIVHAAELKRGVIEVYHGWEAWRINLVTFDHVTDPISGFPLLKGVPVRIETIERRCDGTAADPENSG